MRSAPDITNVLEAANLDGRQERLEGMLGQLESCEKALQVGWRAGQLLASHASRSLRWQQPCRP